MYFMAEVMTMRLTTELERDLTLVAKQEQLDKSTALRRLLGTSIAEWKKEYAITKYKEGSFSTEQAAKAAGLSLWAFFDLLKQRKIPVTYDTEELESDLKTIQWKQ